MARDTGDAIGASGTNADAVGGTYGTDALEVVQAQFGRQFVVPRSAVDDWLVHRMREILADDSYIWAGISVRMEVVQAGQTGGFAFSFHYEATMLTTGVLCLDAAAADRYWRYAMINGVKELWERANEGRPPVTRPERVPWLAMMYPTGAAMMPDEDRHLLRLLSGVTPAVAWALIE